MMNYSNLPEQEYKMYPTRYRVVGLFVLVQMMTSVLLNTLTPIAAYLSDIYNQDPFIVTLGGLLFTLMHPIFTFPAAFVIDTYGAKTGIIVGSTLGIIGVSLRLLVNQGFAWIIVGQVIAGIGRPFILNCQAKISAGWFSADKRGGITQLLTLILNISLIIGLLIPVSFFSSYTTGQTTVQRGKQLTFNLMLFEAIMGAVCFGSNLFLQLDKPPTPPSPSADIKRQPFTIAIPKMLKNKNYLFLLIGFGCYFGIFNGLSIILSFLLQPWFPENLSFAAAAVGGSPVISGIIGVGIIGPMQRKSKTFKKWILICMTGSSVAILLFYPLLQTDILFLVAMISAFNSFFLIPLVPIMLQLGCQLIFPVGQGSAVGLLFANGNLCGFIFGSILGAIVKGQNKSQSATGLGFCFGIFMIGILLMILMKQQKNRQKSQSQASSQRSELQTQLTKQKPVEQKYRPPNLSIDGDNNQLN